MAEANYITPAVGIDALRQWGNAYLEPLTQALIAKVDALITERLCPNDRSLVNAAASRTLRRRQLMAAKLPEGAQAAVALRGWEQQARSLPEAHGQESEPVIDRGVEHEPEDSKPSLLDNSKLVIDGIADLVGETVGKEIKIANAARKLLQGAAGIAYNAVSDWEETSIQALEESRMAREVERRNRAQRLKRIHATATEQAVNRTLRAFLGMHPPEIENVAHNSEWLARPYETKGGALPPVVHPCRNLTFSSTQTDAEGYRPLRTILEEQVRPGTCARRALGVSLIQACIEIWALDKIRASIEATGHEVLHETIVDVARKHRAALRSLIASGAMNSRDQILQQFVIASTLA